MDQDVHHELVKFLEDAGRWHRRIDDLGRKRDDERILMNMFQNCIRNYTNAWPKLDEEHKEFLSAFLKLLVLVADGG